VRLHPVIASLLLALGSAALAFVAAALADAVGLGTAGASIAAALVVAAAFAYRPVDGLLGFGIAILFADTVEYWTGGNIRYVDEAAVVLFVLVAFTVHRGRMRIPTPGWREGALAVFFLAGVISSLIQAVPANVWILGFALLAKTFVFFYLVTSLSVTSEEVRRLSTAALIVGLAVSAVGIVEFLAPDFAIAFMGVIPYARSRGAVEIVNSWFTTPALYGWIAPFLSLFLFARFAVLRERWALVLAFVLGGAGLLSGRRTPLVSMVVSLAVGAVRAMRSRRISWRPVAAIGAGVVLVAALSVWSFGDFYATTFETYVGRPHRIMEVFAEKPRHWRVDVLHPRTALYAGSIAIARDKFPLGVGIGRYGSHMSREEYSPVYREYGLHKVMGLRHRRPIAVTDTFWPMVLGESGVIGLLGCAAFFAFVVRDLWRAALPLGPPLVRIFTLGALMVFVEALVRSAAAPVFVAPPIAYWVFGAAGLALSLRASVTEADAAPTS
jgi:hypothetical protein